MPESILPPAGWYPDPHDPSKKRYWDGAHWAQETTRPIPAAMPVAGGAAAPAAPAGDSGGTTWWKRTWVIALAAWVLGIIMGSAAASGGSESNDGSDNKASSTVTVTAEPSPGETVTETVTETAAPEQPEEPQPAEQAEGSLPLEDGDWRLDSVQLKNDGVGDFGGTARITYIGESQNADNLFTITVLDKNGGVVASLTGSAEGMDPGGTETVDLISFDKWKPGNYTSFDFQKEL